MMNFENFKFRGDSFVDRAATLSPHKDALPPRFITFQITDACNLKCTYCYQHGKSNHVMDLKVATTFIDNLFDKKYDNYNDYSNSAGLILEFIGGEPFLQVDLIDQIVDYFFQKLIDTDSPWLYLTKISICTNGTLYFTEKVQNFIRKHQRHLFLTISIDGNKELHDSCRIFPDGRGSYDMAMEAAKHYAKFYLGTVKILNSKMTISPDNLPHLISAVKSLIDVGYESINLNCTYEGPWDEKDAYILYTSLKEIGDYLLQTGKYKTTKLSIFDPSCGAPKPEDDLQNWCGGNGKMLAIDYKGDLFPCLRYMESSLSNKQEPYIIGTVENGIMSTVEEKNRVQLLQSVNRKTCSSEECFNCPVAGGCSWCTAYNYECFGTPQSRVTNICIMHKARVLANAYYWNKIFRIEAPEERRRFKIHLPVADALKIIDLDEWTFLKMLESSVIFS